ncbi:Universal stress protein A [Bibersteinia trehalosi USDA-ARS-USMARC-188]|uniref:Universal stress protein n=5 Tax=Bibersteinia trehalosi TaxID=47735 RepID=W0R7X0_BIBTR|nr:universal stress protein [Bibersteinia trehalosi]AGH38412.1 Universal stress protein A [Bibersteinia trehalosi USDA-ARS-USMARC-192]AHG81789.1 Universal stress protein A [Bibersteinia trehalosi USDA-ARS-USMARC-188]AHG84078.1 Universal stress protein A [Bibersteinia trehalosi USDA-ARS-USMARC-189]AHG86400.1 Universal stress protein A [Bibersteinia trehalosi USDA-ARS-USMARC-190]OAQ15086.1 universal stress protein A [Bibersteinia trehalosi Y31]
MYKHVLVAVDLSEESLILVRKGADIAKRHGAKLSIIHVDVNFSDLYTGLIDINMQSVQNSVSEDTVKALDELASKSDYPVTERLNGSGDFSQVLEEAVDKYQVDLLVTGHHQDFWSKFMSSTRQVMNSISIDMLVVPLADE